MKTTPSPRIAALLAVTLSCLNHSHAQQAAAIPPPPAAEPEPVVQLSPFEVVADNKGYYSATTMSGTRLNAKIEDLGSSIQVVSKEQMNDFAMLDINDVFLYTGNTEGTGTFTDFTVNRNGDIFDNVQLDPTQANRIRGIGPANISLSNTETMGRTPIDPSAIDAVEVSRGPNANVFGLGNSSGTVNMVGSSANLSRDKSQVSFRADSYDGYRGSIDLNRTLKKNVLAVRLIAVRQHDGFVRKPSGTDTDRFNGMVKIRPLKDTTISASYAYYNLTGKRPNSSMPRDNVSYWVAQGRPTWDPVSMQVHRNGTTVGTFTSATGLPDYFTSGYTGTTRSQVYVDRDGIGYWCAPTGVSGTSPNSNTQSQRLMTTNAAPVRTNQPLFTTTPALNDGSLYDWKSVNYAAINRIKDKSETSSVQIDQLFFHTARQSLAGQASWGREDSERYARNLIGIFGEAGATGALQVDVNERMLDGSPNPYFLRPFIGVAEPITQSIPQRWDTYRAQLAYQLDLTREPGMLRWLGLHQVTAYNEYKNRLTRFYCYRDVMVDNHAWIPAGAGRANQGTNSGPNITRSFFRFYAGDNQGQNVDYPVGNFSYGTYPFVWGNAATGVFNREPTQLGLAASQDKSGGSRNSFIILKTLGGVIQSHLLEDKVVTTFGLRTDDSFTKFGNASRLLPDGINYDHSIIDHWAPGDYLERSGRTSQAGVVVRPFRDLGGLSQAARGGGASGLAAGALRFLSLSYNQSDSFMPATPAQNLMLEEVPNPHGSGKDYGAALSLFDGKLVVRWTRYTTTQEATRNTDSATLVTRVLGLDYVSSNVFQLKANAQRWIAATNPTFTPQQVTDAVGRAIGLTEADEDALDAIPRTETGDTTARGQEISVNFNATNYWTAQLNFAETRSINRNLATGLSRWIAKRMPIWTTIKDPTINPAIEPSQLWWNHNYGGSQTASQNFDSFVASPLQVIQALEGKSRPQIGRYSGNLSTNVKLSGLTEHPLLKRFSVSGALRWRDKSAIGFFGKQQLPATITELDINRPIWDKARFYADASVAYRTRLFASRLGATFQLNVRNLQESGRLQPTGAYPDGTPYSYRIVDPRMFILSATFDL